LLLLTFTSGIMANDSAPQGVVEGRVMIFPLSDVNLADDATTEKGAVEQPYSEYPLIVRSPDGKQEIAHVTPDKDGNYRLALPAGDYILDVEGPGRGRVRTKPKPFSVAPNRTVRVDLQIDTGIR
jgi:hypothetical protein